MPTKSGLPALWVYESRLQRFARRQDARELVRALTDEGDLGQADGGAAGAECVCMPFSFGRMDASELNSGSLHCMTNGHNVHAHVLSRSEDT